MSPSLNFNKCVKCEKKSFVEGSASKWEGGSGEEEIELKHFTKAEENGKEEFCRSKQVDKEGLEKKK